MINVSQTPLKRYLGYQIIVNDGNYGYSLISVGSAATQTTLALLLGLIPVITAALAIWVFMKSFYQVKFNEIGVTEKAGLFGLVRPRIPDRELLKSAVANIFSDSRRSLDLPTGASTGALAVEAGSPNRRTVLIATMEYEIEDWSIKVKIGGLG